MLGSEKSEFRVIIFSVTKAFNSENIGQVCLVSSKTHRANKDFSNPVKDALSELSYFGIEQ